MAKGFKAISVSDEEYGFFKEFAERLSNELGVELRLAQALKMAVTQYEVKHKLTGKTGRKAGDE